MSLKITVKTKYKAAKTKKLKRGSSCQHLLSQEGLKIGSGTAPASVTLVIFCGSRSCFPIFKTNFSPQPARNIHTYSRRKPTMQVKENKIFIWFFIGTALFRATCSV